MVEEYITNCKSNIDVVINCVFNNPEIHDVIFEVNGKKIYALKCTIYNNSQYFTNLFSNKFKQEKTIVIHDTSIKLFKNLLKFLISGQITITKYYIYDLVIIAERFCVQYLVEECIKAVYYLKLSDKEKKEILLKCGLVQSNKFIRCLLTKGFSIDYPHNVVVQICKKRSTKYDVLNILTNIIPYIIRFPNYKSSLIQHISLYKSTCLSDLNQVVVNIKIKYKTIKDNHIWLIISEILRYNFSHIEEDEEDNNNF